MTDANEEYSAFTTQATEPLKTIEAESGLPAFGFTGSRYREALIVSFGLGIVRDTQVPVKYLDTY